MKILAVVDLHGKKELYEHISKLVEKSKPDLIISAGDHTWFGDKERAWLKKLDFGVPVLLIPGNHEVPEGTKKAAKGLKHIIWIHQGAYEKSDILFLGCGEGGLCCGNSDFEKVKNFFSKELKSYGGKKVLITHEPPYGTKADQLSLGNHVGSKSLRKFVEEEKPHLHICGHIHEAAGGISKLGKTLVINPGPGGKIINL